MFPTDKYMGQMFIGFVLGALALWRLRSQGRRIPRILVVTWVYFLLSALYTSMVKEVQVSNQMGEMFKIFLGAQSAHAALVLLLIPLIALAASGRFLMYLLMVVVAANAAMIIWFGGHGIFGANTFDVALYVMIGLTLTFKDIGKIHWAWDLAFLVSLLTSTLLIGSSTALVILIAGLTAWTLTRRNWWLLVAPFTLGAGLLLAPQWLASGTRVEEWKNLLEWWWGSGPRTIIFGTGVGSFEWLGRLLDVHQFGKTNHIFLWVHNDWLQALLEGGVVGFVLLCASALWCLKEAFRLSPWLFVGFVCFGACMLTYHPLHWTVPQIWLALLVKELLVERNAHAQIYED